MTKTDVKRWLAVVGLKSYKEGRRPELGEKVVRRTVDLAHVDIG